MDHVQDILREIREVTSDGERELPRVQRNFRQLIEEGNELYAKHTAQPVSEADGIAFLGARGVDILSARRFLDTLTAAPALQRPAEPNYFDVPSYLERAKESIVLDLFRDAEAEVRDACDEAARADADAAWTQLKNEMADAEYDDDADMPDGTRPPTRAAAASALGGRSLQLVVDQNSRTLDETLGGGGVGGGGTEIDSMGARFVRKLIDHDMEAIAGKPSSDLLDKFMDAVDEFKSHTIKTRWDLVYQYKKLAPGRLRESDPGVYRASPDTVDQIVFIGRRYLEEKHLDHLEKAVWSNLSNVELQRSAGRFELIRNYWRTVISPSFGGSVDEASDSFVADVPAWAFLFYALRSGDMATVGDISDAAGPAFDEIRPYLEEMRASPLRRLKPESEAKIRLMYRRDVVHCSDPYRKAVHCVLGACDFCENHDVICFTTDDYMWVKLCQLRGRVTDASGKPISSSTFVDFQRLIVDEYGEAHFKAQTNPDLYFMVVMLSGQLEKAFEFLYRLEGAWKTEALHMALAMKDLGLLVPTKNTRRNMLHTDPRDPPGIVQLNMGRMVILYARKFSKVNYTEALHYYYQLVDYQHGDDNAFERLSAELVLSVGNPEYFFGKLTADWSRSPGALDVFARDTERVVLRVAEELSARGEVADSVSLLFLCRRADDGLELLLRHLGGLAAQRPGSAASALAKRRELVVQARAALSFMAERGRGDASPYLHEALRVLMRFVDFFDAFFELKLQSALEILESMRVLPFDVNDLGDCVEGSKRLHGSLQRLLPEVIVTALAILFQLYQAAKAENEGGRIHITLPRKAVDLRDKSSVVIAFAGFLSDLPADVTVQITQYAGLIT